MDHRGRADPLDTLVVLRAQVNILKETFPAAEQQRDEHEVQIIDESGSQVLTDRCPPTARHDIPALRGLSRLCERGLNSGVNEVEGRATLQLERRPG